MRHTNINIDLIQQAYIATMIPSRWYILLPQLELFFINPGFHHDISLYQFLSISFSLTNVSHKILFFTDCSRLGWARRYALYISYILQNIRFSYIYYTQFVCVLFFNVVISINLNFTKCTSTLRENCIRASLNKNQN